MTAKSKKTQKPVDQTLQEGPTVVGQLFADVSQIIENDREGTYGDPGKNLRAIADYWTVHLRHKYNFTGALTTDDVCQFMVSLKQARLLNNPTHRDSIVDSIGYAALQLKVQNA